MKVSIGRAARELGVSRDTLRRWEADGKIPVERTTRGRRLYDLSKLCDVLPSTRPAGRITLAYARVGSEVQKEYLSRQVALLESYCTINGWVFEVVRDIGIGASHANRGLRQLVRRICSGEVCRLVITNHDRLPNLCLESLLALCKQFGAEVVIVNPPHDSSSQEDDLAGDIQELASIFSARLRGQGGDSVKQLLSTIKGLVDAAASRDVAPDNVGVLTRPWV